VPVSLHGRNIVKIMHVGVHAGKVLHLWVSDASKASSQREKPVAILHDRRDSSWV
jgi:hypothetical protein